MKENILNDDNNQNVNSYLPKPEVTSFVIKATLGAFFFIAGFNFANTVFFRENPLFGVNFLAETILSFAAAAFGYHTIPLAFLTLKNWFESFLTSTISNIVWEFWNEQTKRMQASRRTSQRSERKEKERKQLEKFEDGVFIDTSVLIDGRLIEVANTGFIPQPLIIDQTVIEELHLIADSEDPLKRQKGRRGLDIIEELKKTKSIKIEFCESHTKLKGVDSTLVHLSKKNKAKLMTMDFNLNKVATVAGVKVLNLNELVDAVKPAVLPGEVLKDIKIVQKGKERGQGVGYMADGTMIVVENGLKLVGEKVDVTVSRLIQSPAGKMIFCTVEKD